MRISDEEHLDIFGFAMGMDIYLVFFVLRL